MNSSEICCSNYTGIVYEFGRCELGFWMEPAGRKMRQERFANRIEQKVSCYGDSPAKDEHLRVKHRGETRASSAKPAAELSQRLERARVARGNELADLVASQLAGGGSRIREGESDPSDIRDRVRHAKERSPRAVLLDASARAATAGQTIRNNPEVTYLGARPEAASKKAILGHNRSPDTSADGEHRHVAVKATSPEAKLGPSGRVGVVVDRDVEIQALQEFRAKRLVTPVDVGRVVDG